VLLTQFFNQYNNSQDNSYRISDLKSLVQGDVITFYIDFEERDPKWKSNLIYIQLLRKADLQSRAFEPIKGPTLESFSKKMTL